VVSNTTFLFMSRFYILLPSFTSLFCCGVEYYGRQVSKQIYLGRLAQDVQRSNYTEFEVLVISGVSEIKSAEYDKSGDQRQQVPFRLVNKK